MEAESDPAADQARGRENPPGTQEAVTFLTAVLLLLTLMLRRRRR